MKIELVYFEGCPNAEAARANLKTACLALGLKPKWAELDQNDGNAPDYAMRFGSPSILVEGKDVAGGPGECCTPKSCRVYEGGQNAPDTETIKMALQESLRP